MRSMRRRRALSDGDVAERMGYGRMGRQQIDRWERGDRGIGAGRLLLYLEAIGATFGELDGELGSAAPPNPRLVEIAVRLQRIGNRR